METQRIHSTSLASRNFKKQKTIDITESQVANYAGNMLQVKGSDDKSYLIMSQSAYDALTLGRIKRIEVHTQIVSSSLSIIEACGGGSARCMMAEVFLPRA